MTRYWLLLRDHPDFTRLWLSQVVSLLGDWFNTIVLSVLVVRYSPGREGLALTLFLLARFIPPMVLSPVAGVLVDRFNRKWLLIASNALRGVTVLGFLLVIHDPDLVWAIYLLTVIQFVLSSVFEPGQSALIPALVDKDNWVEANTLVSVTWSVMLALGAVVGGVISTLFGAQTALLLDALTFGVAALLIVWIRSYEYKPRQQMADGTEEDTSFREGLRFLRKNPQISSTLMVKSGGSLGNIDALMTIYATQLFALTTVGLVTVGQTASLLAGLGSRLGDPSMLASLYGVTQVGTLSNSELSLGLMFSAFGLGAILGPVLLNRVNDGTVSHMRRLIIIGFVLAAGSWWIFGWAGTLFVACVALLIRGAGGSANWTYSTVIIQKSTPDRYLGRVFSLDMMGFHAMTVASIIVHGALIDIVGGDNVRAIALGTGIPALVPLILWVLVVRWLENQETSDVQPLDSAPVIGD